MAIKITDLTKGETKGSGLFDELMRTLKYHLQEELNEGRITKANYATVYLGALQNNLNIAADFVLKREIANEQITLLKKQVEEAEYRNTLLTKEILSKEIANTTAEYNLSTLLPAQLDNQLTQTALVQQQRLEMIAKTTLTEAQIVQSTNESVAKVLLMTKQEDMIDEQILTEKANTKTPTAGMAYATYTKTLKELEVLNQKLITEQAQTEGDVSELGGLVGAEIALKTVQANSFARDSEIKAAKIYSDTFSMLFATDSTNLSADWGLGPVEATRVLDKLRDGINAN